MRSSLLMLRSDRRALAIRVRNQCTGETMEPLQALRLAMNAVDAWYKERGIFQGKFGFGKSPALVVIDMAYGWTDASYTGGSARLDSAVAAIAKLLPMAREKKLPVFYTTALYSEQPQFKSAAESAPGFRKWDRR